ncbi:hypothetical protein [Ancylobacter sp. G4_0304]
MTENTIRFGSTVSKLPTYSDGEWIGPHALSRSRFTFSVDFREELTLDFH